MRFVIFLVLLAATGAWYWVRRGTPYLVAGPGLFASLGVAVLAVLMAVSIGLWTSVLAANTRDVRFTLGYVLELWMFVTPVIYPVSVVPERWRWLVSLNPAAPIVETFKWGLLGVGHPRWMGLAGSAAVTIVILVSGLWYFGRAESAAVDRI